MSTNIQAPENRKRKGQEADIYRRATEHLSKTKAKQKGENQKKCKGWCGAACANSHKAFVF
jgi:hypothetical protein